MCLGKSFIDAVALVGGPVSGTILGGMVDNQQERTRFQGCMQLFEEGLAIDLPALGLVEEIVKGHDHEGQIVRICLESKGIGLDLHELLHDNAVAWVGIIEGYHRGTNWKR